MPAAEAAGAGRFVELVRGSLPSVTIETEARTAAAAAEAGDTMVEDEEDEVLRQDRTWCTPTPCTSHQVHC